MNHELFLAFLLIARSINLLYLSPTECNTCGCCGKPWHTLAVVCQGHFASYEAHSPSGSKGKRAANSSSHDYIQRGSYFSYLVCPSRIKHSASFTRDAVNDLKKT